MSKEFFDKIANILFEVPAKYSASVIVDLQKEVSILEEQAKEEFKKIEG